MYSAPILRGCGERRSFRKFYGTRWQFVMRSVTWRDLGPGPELNSAPSSCHLPLICAVSNVGTRVMRQFSLHVYNFTSPSSPPLPLSFARAADRPFDWPRKYMKAFAIAPMMASTPSPQSRSVGGVEEESRVSTVSQAAARQPSGFVVGPKVWKSFKEEQKVLWVVVCSVWWG